MTIQPVDQAPAPGYPDKYSEIDTVAEGDAPVGAASVTRGDGEDGSGEHIVMGFIMRIPPEVSPDDLLGMNMPREFGAKRVLMETAWIPQRDEEAHIDEEEEKDAE